jgi:DNA primase
VVDIQALKATVDLVGLIGRDTRLKKVATTRGGEWAGPCPFCGGRDRLRVQPDRGLWWCRSCSDDRWQDAIAYVQKRDSVDFRGACERLGADIREWPKLRVEPRRLSVIQDDTEPTEAWRAAAGGVVAQCESVLWSDTGERARRYLHEQRGLTDETIRRWRLGYSPTDQRIAGLWVQRGILIPWFVDGEVWQLKIRRPPGLEPKYVSVSGGHPVLFGAETLRGHRVAVLCEGEFDAMLLEQIAGAWVGVATLGSCSKALSERAVLELLPISRVLVAYDLDADGEKGAERLVSLSARMRRVPPPIGKDLTEAWQMGARLHDWAAFHAAKYEASR